MQKINYFASTWRIPLSFFCIVAECATIFLYTSALVCVPPLPHAITGEYNTSSISIMNLFICCLQNGSTALHAAVMGGNIRSVLLLLGANADPSLPNKVRHVDLKHETEHEQITSACKLFLVCVSQSNELPADLTKSDRILKVLHPKMLNGDSWWRTQTAASMPACKTLTGDVYRGGGLNNNTVSNLLNYNMYCTWCLLLIATEMKPSYVE